MGRYFYQMNGGKLTLTRGASSRVLAKIDDPCLPFGVYACLADARCTSATDAPACKGTACAVYRDCRRRAPTCVGLPEQACTTNTACYPSYTSSCPICENIQYLGCNDRP
jgi:hypothetical protein